MAGQKYNNVGLPCVKVYALGGLDENGKNCYCIETLDAIFVIECGSKYPDLSTPGVDIIIPDFSYLEQNKEKVKAVIISHGHDDEYNALPYLLKKIAETKKKVYIISSLAFFVKEFAVFGPTAPYYKKNINFTKILAKLARKYNLKLIPMTKLMKEFSDVSADMLHPSLKGHLAIATNLAKIIKKG